MRGITMNLLNTFIMTIVVVCLIIITVIHSKYIYASWCEAEIEILRFQIDDIHNQIVKD